MDLDCRCDQLTWLKAFRLRQLDGDHKAFLIANVAMMTDHYILGRLARTTKTLRSRCSSCSVLTAGF